MATTPAKGSVFLAETEMQVDEAAGFAVERILRTGSLAEEVTITYGVTADTATAGQDFVGGIGTVVMPAGASEISVRVPILDDAVGEPTETLVFSLINAEGATPWAPRTSRISIVDDETPPPPADPEPPLTPAYDVEQVPLVGGLNQPIRMEFSPLDPSETFVAEKGGVIRIADLATGASSVFLDISDRVNEHVDRGLLDIALHPDFANNPYIYAFYTVDPPDTAGQDGAAGPDGAGNRYNVVSRFTADAATGFRTVVPGSEVVLLGKAGQSLADISGGGALDFTDPAFAGEVASDRYLAPGTDPWVVNGFKQDYLKGDSASHMGGALAFGPDGALYVSTGDGTSFDFADPRSPDVLALDSLSGKILRIDPMTGQGLADNPFVDAEVSLDSNRAKVFQLGLRNPFSMTFDQEGRLFLTNTGWNSWEMVFTGGPGANFGWPYYEGGDSGTLLETPGYRDFPGAAAFHAAVQAGDIEVTAPFRAFSHNSDDPGFQVQAITGGEVVYTGDRYPASFLNSYIFTDFAENEVYAVDTQDPTDVRFLFRSTGFYAPIDFRQGADGYVYYVDIASGEIGRLEIAELQPPPGGPPVRILRGTEGDDILVGGAGVDSMLGGLGSDTASYESSGAAVVASLASPAANTGDAAGDSYSSIENLRGSAFADRLLGDGGTNQLEGLAGDDTLDGGIGADRMTGGQGDDTYLVDAYSNNPTLSDLTFEGPSGGVDTVITSIGAYLYANIENLVLDAAAGAAFGVGNALANRVTGNAAANRLLGGAGDDTLDGGGGNDQLFGQDGADRLDGGAGADRMTGGRGDDVYVVDRYSGIAAQSDLTFEQPGGGYDTVIARTSVYLYANIENLVLDAAAGAAFGVGNALANRVTGNAAANRLLGGAGNDTLDGGAGVDVLFGQAGLDLFVLHRGSGADQVGDFQPGTDRVDLHDFGLTEIGQLQARMVQTGAGVLIGLGGGDSVLLRGVALGQLGADDFILA